MINFLHTFNPSPILLSLGPINIYWYGFLIILGVLSAISVSIILGKFYGIKPQTIIDLTFWLIIGGLMGARIYHVFLEFPYYLANPLSIFKIWQGGLAIHGAIIGGLVALWLYVKKLPAPSEFWQLACITITALPLAQAFGRWGNYFNQELFGRPTNLPWGIPIDQINRPWQYLNFEYFHPAFLYESLGNLVIFIILLSLQIWLIKKQEISRLGCEIIIISYAFFYSLLRFFIECLRTDPTPIILGWRFSQLVSLFIITLTILYSGFIFWRKMSKNPTLDK